MIKLMVCGSREITDERFIFNEIEKYIAELNDDVIIIEGKTVQCKTLKYDFCFWMDDSNPCWNWNHYEYRIKQNLEK